MSFQTIQYSFIAGEISPTYLGRQDLKKYDGGLELAKNWYVDYRGGLSTRPGLEFVDYIQHDDKETKFFRFRYSPDIANTYVLLFGDNYVRFLQDGAYILETAKAITSITAGTPGVVNSTAHGYVAGDWVKIAGRTYQVGTVTADTWQMLTPFGTNFTATDSGAGTSQRVYTVATPYDAEDLAKLRATQHLNKIRLTHKDYAPRVLERIDVTNWTLAEEAFENTVGRPTSSSHTSFDDTVSSLTYAITAIDAYGNEGLPFYAVAKGVTRIDEATNYITFSWTAVDGAVSYNIYRTRSTNSTTFGSGQQVGYLGSSNGLSFTDNGILPDFAVTPPQGYNPFANGAIKQITITNGGTGYPQDTTTVTITDPTPGAGGFAGFPAIDKNGNIESVIIISGGKGYANPTVVFTGAPGASATATAATTPLDGNNPSIFAVFQQRGIYAATLNEPITLWGSKPGEFNDFSYSDIVVEDDSYTFTLDSEEISPIKHMFASRGGLLLMSASGVWLLTGGDQTAVSPINALADPQSYSGVSDVPPIALGPDILYVESKGSSVKLLSYNDFARVYGGNSMSILANHLFAPDRQIKTWSYSESPANIIWAVRTDGALLPFTFIKEQDVFAWTQCFTQGLFLDLISVREGIYDREYLTTQRKINGRWTKMIERMVPREIDHVEDAWCVDCGLALPQVSPAATVELSAVSGSVTATADAGVFSADDVGKIFRGGGAKGTVTAYNGPTSLTIDLIRELTYIIPETTIPRPLLSGDWTLDEEVMSAGGLWHLEGETVSILADGSVMAPRVVVNGSVTFDYPVSRAIIGLGFRAIARNLPLTAADAVVEEKRKRIVGVGVRTHDTRGLKLGVTLDKLYEMKDRTNEPLAEPTRLRSDMRYEIVGTQFDQNGQMYFVQDYPLPATILGLVSDFEVGDDDPA